MAELIVDIGIPLFFLMLGWVAGRTVERRHIRDLEEREARLRGMLVTDVKTFPGGADPTKRPVMVTAQCVIATDYLKTFLAGVRKLVGGEMRSYRTLLERARREAVLRLLEQADQRGFDALCNLRINTADLGNATRSRGAAMVEVFATGTAYLRSGEGADARTL